MTTLPSRRLILGATVGTAALSLTGGRAAQASSVVPRPSIIGCGTWGAEPARSAITMQQPATSILIHHTASANVTDYSLTAAHQIARQIQQWHFANGWADSGQHFTVSRGGYVLEGRHRTVEGLDGGQKLFPLGAHSLSLNRSAIGIENQGTYTSATPTTAQWAALVNLCAYLCQAYNLSPSTIHGHGEYDATACPGAAFAAKLPQLRLDVTAKLGGSTTTRTWPVLRPGATGFRVSAAQYLLRQAGQVVTANGTYDEAMKPKVQAFQTAKGLDPDGVIGRLSWEAPLAVTTRPSTSGEAVRAVQVALNGRGNALTVDGIFGTGTRLAVEAFQSSVGLTPDGVVGLDTWSRVLI